jgi:hypothetical protein
VVKGVKAIFLGVQRGWGLLGERKERRITRRTRRRIIIIIKNRAKTISLQTLFGRLNKHWLEKYLYKQYLILWLITLSACIWTLSDNHMCLGQNDRLASLIYTCLTNVAITYKTK